MGVLAERLANAEHPMMRVWSGVRALRTDDDGDGVSTSPSELAARECNDVTSTLRHLSRVRAERGAPPLLPSALRVVDEGATDDGGGGVLDPDAPASAHAQASIAGGVTQGGGGCVTRLEVEASVASAEARITQRVGAIETKLDGVAQALATLLARFDVPGARAARAGPSTDTQPRPEQ